MECNLRDLLDLQHGVIAAWQLDDLAISVRHRHRLRLEATHVHQGVFRVGFGPLSLPQRWWAATLTTPDGVLSHASAGASFEFFRQPSDFVTITRPGSGGRCRPPGLLVCHSQRMAPPDVTFSPCGCPVTSPSRTALDLVAALPDRAARRVVRDALRIGAVDAITLESEIRRSRGRRGVARLRLFTADYARLPSVRARSDAEVLALATLEGAGIPEPELNTVIAGFEADLTWPAARLIVEVDGESFHHPVEDARRDNAWTEAGWRVVRLAADVVYDDPNLLIATARRALTSAALA